MMLTNPIINRIAIVVLLFCLYAAGYDSAKQETVKAHHNCTAEHLPLKP
jgi:hypothetical protein